MCRLHLEHLDHLEDMIAELDAQVEEMMAPFRPQRDLLISIPGIGPRASAAIVSEIGADPGSWFPTPEQLASWTGLCPGNHESAGKRHHGKRRKGNQHLQPWLVECAWAAVRTDGYLRSFYRRQVRKFGGFGSPLAKKKAIIAVAHKLITIVWHVLTTGRPTRISVPTTSPAASTPRSRPVASSPNYKPRDTPSPSNPPPDHLNTPRHKITRLRRVASPAVVTSIHVPADGTPTVSIA